jgi:integrase
MAVKVRERKGAWWVVIRHKSIPNKGHCRWKRVGTGKAGKRAAEAAAEKIQAKLALGEAMPWQDRAVPTFREAAERWLATYGPLRQLRESTRDLYKRNLETHVFPRFGPKPVTQVSREDMRALIADLLGRGRSRSMIHNVIAPIRQTLGQLVEDGVLVVNPAERLGRYLRDKTDARLRIDPLTVEEEALFLSVARVACPRHYPMLLCALRTGLRLGELRGLQWGDLDFQGRFVEVRRSLQDGGRVELPKNGKIRRVDMSAHLAEALQRLRAARAEEALKRGWGAIPDWLFCNEDGRPLWKSDFERRIFHRVLAKAGLRRVRFHDLRHTFASRLIQNGESLAYVRDQMGHHSIKVTVDIYGHLVPGANKAAVDRLDATTPGVSDATIRDPGVTEDTSGATGRPVTPQIQMVELRGVEPLTPRLPASCSPN